MSDLVGKQNVGFLMTRRICQTADLVSFIQDYEIRIKNLQEEVERHSMMSSMITVSDLTSELELIEGNLLHLIVIIIS